MTQYISIKDAATLSDRSSQTIRRMIKAKRVKYRKDRTPQGFNYLVDLESLQENYKISPLAIKQFFNTPDAGDVSPQAVVKNSAEVMNTAQAEAVTKVKTVDLDLRAVPTASTTEAPVNESENTTNQTLTTLEDRSHQQIVNYEPVKEFTSTMQKLIEQHGKEKENLFRLVETFQNKVIALENKIKVEANTKKSWFKLW